MADHQQQPPQTVVSIEDNDDNDSTRDEALREEFIRVTTRPTTTCTTTSSSTPLNELEPMVPDGRSEMLLNNNTFDSSNVNNTTTNTEETFEDEHVVIGSNNHNTHTDIIGDEVDLEGLEEEVEVGSLRAFEEEPVHDFSERVTKNENDPLQEKQKLYAMGASGCCCLSILLALVILSVVLTGHGKTTTAVNEKSAPPPVTVVVGTAAPPTNLVVPLPAYSRQAMAENTLSPQALAYQWLVQDPNLASYSEERRLQRYAMSTLYYSWRGANWTIGMRPWNDYQTNECHWFQAPADLTERESLKLDRWWTCWQEAEQETTGGNNGNLPSLGSAPEKEDYASPHSQMTPPRMNLPESLFDDHQKEGGVRKRRQLQEKSPPTWGLRRLHLPNNNLVGRLPPELALLTNLESIHLSENTLFGSLALSSMEASTFPHMKALNVSYNLLTETTEDASTYYVWHAMEDLETLDVSHNAIQKLQTGSSGALSKLANLNVAFNNDMTGSLGELLLHFLGPTDESTALTSLQAHHNQISGDLRSLALLTHLRYLSLDDNQLTGSLGTSIGLLTNLEDLLLYNNALTSSIPSDIGNLSALQVLGLHTNQLVGSIPTEVGVLSNLKAMWLYDNALTGPLPTNDLAALAALEVLILYDNPDLTGTVPASLCEGLGESLQFDCVEGMLCGCDCPCERRRRH